MIETVEKELTTIIKRNYGVYGPETLIEVGRIEAAESVLKIIYEFERTAQFNNTP